MTPLEKLLSLKHKDLSLTFKTHVFLRTGRVIQLFHSAEEIETVISWPLLVGYSSQPG